MATANGISTGTTFSPELVSEVFSKVKGHSSLARLSAQEGVPFVGKDIVTLSMDGEVAIVGEGAAKPEGAADKGIVTVKPIKVVYQKRFSDEFLRCSEEKQLDFLEKFSDGLAKKVARGLDIMAFLGVNPAAKEASALIGDNCFKSKVKASVNYDAAEPDSCIDEAIALVEGAEYVCDGLAMAPKMRGDISKMKTQSGARLYPDFAFGGTPAKLGSCDLDVNSTLSYGVSTLTAVVGNFQDAFTWGMCEEVNFEVIEYGDPDGQGTDLKNRNQVCLRAEAYIAWGILDENAFAVVVDNSMS